MCAEKAVKKSLILLPIESEENGRLSTNLIPLRTPISLTRYTAS